MLKRGVEPDTRTYVRELVLWGLAAFPLLATFVVISQGGFSFLKGPQGWDWARVASFVAATFIASAVVAIVALWSERPRRHSQD